MTRYARYRPDRPGYVGGALASSNAGVSGPQLHVDLLEYWDMDEASGTRAGAHAGADLALNDGAIGSRAGNGGGTAADFPFTAGEYFVNSDGLRPSGSFSVSVWIYLDAIDANGHTVGGVRPNTAGNDVWNISVYNASGVMPYISVFDGLGGSQFVQWTGTITAAAWHHLAAWYDASTKKAYLSIDGGSAQESAALTNGLNVTSAADLEVGHMEASLSTLGMWDGGMQAFGYWDRVLTSAELTYLSGGVRLYSDITGYAS